MAHGGEYVLSQQMIATIIGKGMSNPMDALSTRQGATASAGQGGGYGSVNVVNVHMEVHGTVTAQRDLERSLREAVLQTNLRNPTNVPALPAGR